MSSRDPKKIHKQPPYSERKQPPPGSEEEMRPQADHGEASYKGTGRLDGRRALITGADSGIGRAVALAFAREGADVAASYLSEETDARETERLVTEAGRKAVLLPGDIGESAVCETVARKAIVGTRSTEAEELHENSRNQPERSRHPPEHPQSN